VPEGPECRRIAVQLAERVTNRQLLNVEILSGRYQKHGPPEGMEDILEWSPIGIFGAGVHGKFIFVLLEGEWSIWSTLGMTGRWSSEMTKHSRLKFSLSDGDIYFTDPRNFGTVKFVKGKDKILNKIKSLGLDMLAEKISNEDFYSIIRKETDKPLVKVLMDQTKFSGIGNYVKAEALYLSRISPHVLCCDLSDEKLLKLKNSIELVLKESYNSGGTTIQTYSDMHGNPGNYNQKLMVYSQKIDPTGHPVIKEVTADGRTTHWVPDVQK
tara:strand:+ start:6630 stop:7436 length:807 start_codon:yes stop_codon:yes gene_type:complete